MSRQGGRAIDAVVSIRQVAARMGLNRSYVKGAAESFGIRWQPVGPSLVMSEADYVRFKRHMDKQHRARDGRRQSVPA